MDENKVITRLIRAAELAQKGGSERLFDPDPGPTETLGITFNLLRRRKNIDLEFISYETGYAVEELLAFEGGLLPGKRMLEMLPGLSLVIQRELSDHQPAIKTLPTSA